MPMFLAKFTDGSTKEVEARTLAQAAHKSAQDEKRQLEHVVPIESFDLGGQQASDAVLTLRYTMPRAIDVVLLQCPFPPRLSDGELPTMLAFAFVLGCVVQGLFSQNLIRLDDGAAIQVWLSKYNGGNPGDLAEAIWGERGCWHIEPGM